MLDDGKVKDFAAQVFWATCHSGMRHTKGMATKAEVKAHPVLGKGAKARELARSRFDWSEIGGSLEALYRSVSEPLRKAA